MKFVIFNYDCRKTWIITADSKHDAIAKAVEKGFAHDMQDFYYGYEDGQIGVRQVEEEFE